MIEEQDEIDSPDVIEGNDEIRSMTKSPVDNHLGSNLQLSIKAPQEPLLAILEQAEQEYDESSPKTFTDASQKKGRMKLGKLVTAPNPEPASYEMPDLD